MHKGTKIPSAFYKYDKYNLKKFKACADFLFHAHLSSQTAVCGVSRGRAITYADKKCE